MEHTVDTHLNTIRGITQLTRWLNPEHLISAKLVPPLRV